MSKTSPIIRRRRYAIAGGQRPLTGADVEADFQEFHAPTSQLASSHFSGPGVIEGLSVTGETGGGKVVVAPGVAVDAQGRLVVLSNPPGNPGAKSYAHIGEVSAGGGIQPAERVEVPVDLPLASVAGKAVLVTIEHYEGIVDDGTPYDIKELQPWIRLRPVDELDGTEVALAFLQVDADGMIAMFGPAPILKPGRRVASVAAGAVTMRRAVRRDDQIIDEEAASIFATSKGIAVDGSVTVLDELSVHGATTTKGNHSTDGSATIKQDLSVDGSTTVKGDIASYGTLKGKVEAPEVLVRGNRGSVKLTPGYSEFRSTVDSAGNEMMMSLYSYGIWIRDPNNSRQCIDLIKSRSMGVLKLYNSDGNVGVQLSGDGVKNAVIPHTTDPSKQIVYACIEGPEVAAYCRGRATLLNGRVQVTFPEHFTQVVNVDTATIQLTPRSAASKGLAVVGQSAEGFSVCELGEGTGTYDFDYFVTGVRRGHEAFEAVVNADTFALDDDNKGDDAKSPSAKEPPR